MLLLLSLLAVASATPLHHFYYNGYNPYVSHYYNVPAMYQMNPNNMYQMNPNSMYQVDPSGRGIITSALIMQEKATFSAAAAIAAVAADATATPPVVAVEGMSAKTLTGTATLKQNPLTFNRAHYSVYLANAAPNTKLRLGVAAGCTDTAAAAGTALTEITTPPLLVNGVWLTGVSTTHNLNGNGGKTDLTGMMLTVYDIAASTYSGCSSAIA